MSKKVTFCVDCVHYQDDYNSLAGTIQAKCLNLKYQRKENVLYLISGDASTGAYYCSTIRENFENGRPVCSGFKSADDVDEEPKRHWWQTLLAWASNRD